jgi:hypothetical protein
LHPIRRPVRANRWRSFLIAAAFLLAFPLWTKGGSDDLPEAGSGTVRGVEEMYRLDLLPRLKQSVKLDAFPATTGVEGMTTDSQESTLSFAKRRGDWGSRISRVRG